VSRERFASALYPGLGLLLVAALSACGTKEPTASRESAQGSAPPAGEAPAAAAPAGTAGDRASLSTGADDGSATNPTQGGPAAAAAAKPAPGTQSLRFIVRTKETGFELPAGTFEVRLLALDPIREGGAAGAGGGAGKGAASGSGSGSRSTVPARR